MHYVSVLPLNYTEKVQDPAENLVYGSSADLTAMCESLVISAYLYINSFSCILCYFHMLFPHATGHKSQSDKTNWCKLL